MFEICDNCQGICNSYLHKCTRCKGTGLQGGQYALDNYNEWINHIKKEGK